MTRFTVGGQVPGLSEIIASLPLSLVMAGDPPVQIVGLAGEPGWYERAVEALSAGALAVVVTRPVDAPADLADQPHLVLSWPFADSPGLLAAAAEATPLRATAALAQGTVSVATRDDAPAALLDLLIAAGRVFGELTELTRVYDDEQGIFLAGHLSGGAAVTLAVVVSAAQASTMHLRLLTGDGGVEATLPAQAAAPAEVRVIDAHGDRLLPTVWVSAHRASWQRAATVAAGTASTDVAELRRALAVL